MIGRRTIIAEHCAKVTDDIDNEENGAFLRLHGEITSFCIPVYRMGLGCCHQQIVNLGWTPQIDVCCIGRESEDEDNDEDHNRVDIIREERRLDTAEHGVQNDSYRKQKARCWSRHSGEGSNDSRSAGEKHSSDQNVRHQAEHSENQMSVNTISCPDNFEEGMGVGSSSFELNGQGSE